MNPDHKTLSVFVSHHPLAQTATGLVLATGVLCAMASLAGCSDSPAAGCTTPGTCAGDAGAAGAADAPMATGDAYADSALSA
jgi:hypothetical protein